MGIFRIIIFVSPSSVFLSHFSHSSFPRLSSSCIYVINNSSFFFSIRLTHCNIDFMAPAGYIILQQQINVLFVDVCMHSFWTTHLYYGLRNFDQKLTLEKKKPLSGWHLSIDVLLFHALPVRTVKYPAIWTRGIYILCHSPYCLSHFFSFLSIPLSLPPLLLRISYSPVSKLHFLSFVNGTPLLFSHSSSLSLFFCYPTPFYSYTFPVD